MMQRDLVLHLTLIDGIGPATVERMVANIPSDQLHELYQCDVQDLVRCGVTTKLADKIVKGLADRTKLEREITLIEQHNISFITRWDDRYPPLLKQIHIPPLALYVRGQLPDATRPSIAFVGSRQANSYGYDVIKHMIPELVQAGWVIVSGGAVGIDACAHEETIGAGGQTVAIIGSGLLNPYPACHKKLFARIADTGALVSPFPLAHPALPGNFPARNRIIAGMSLGSIVVQAAERSGALITAYAAMHEGREVGVVPGSIFDPLSAGCHRLIQEGATPVAHATDIMKLCGYDLPAQELVTKEAINPLITFCREPRSFDMLLEYEQCTDQELYDRLWQLQVQGLIEETQAGMWVAARASLR